MFVSHHTLKWTRTCRSHGRHPHAHTAHFLLNRHTVRHRRGAPAPPDHRGQLREAEHRVRHEHRVRQMGHGLRGRQARGRDHRQDRASWTPARVHRAEPPRQRGAHVRKDVRRTRVRTQGEDKGTGRNAPWLKSKFFRDQSRNADSTKYAASPALRPPPEAPLCTRRCPRRPSN